MADPNSCIPSHNPRRHCHHCRHCVGFPAHYPRRLNRNRLHFDEGKLRRHLLACGPGETIPVIVGVATGPGSMRCPLQRGLSPWHGFALLLYSDQCGASIDEILSAYYEEALQCSRSQDAHLRSSLSENPQQNPHFATLRMCMCTELI